MKQFKKLAAGVALSVAAMLPAAPASASVVLEFLDGAGTLLLGLSVDPAGSYTGLTLTGVINGWNVNTTLGSSDYTAGALSLNGNATYSAAPAAAVTVGSVTIQPSLSVTTLGLTTGTIPTNLVTSYLPTIGGGSFSGGTVLTSTAPTLTGTGLNFSYINPFTAPLTAASSTLSIKVIDTNFLTTPTIPLGSLYTLNSYFQNNTTSQTQTSLIGVPSSTTYNVISDSFNCAFTQQPCNFTPQQIGGIFTPGATGGTNDVTQLVAVGSGPLLLNTQVTMTDTGAFHPNFQFLDSITVQLPEPGSLALFGLALAGLGVMQRRKAAAAV